MFQMFVPEKFFWFYILHCSDYLHLFDLVSATIAVWSAYFDLIILNSLHQMVVYE